MAAPRRRAGRRRDLSFYLTEQEQAQVAQAAELEGIDAEIALLRVLIKKVKDTNDPKEVRLQIEALCKALRLQHLLSDRSADSLSQSLARVLDEVGAQLEAEP
ncbi:MAG: hypothetical protein HY690_05100 [Chloroflexi bacterium]|nr:hypothetical protein [Chloroflexota bacterium]